MTQVSSILKFRNKAARRKKAWNTLAVAIASLFLSSCGGGGSSTSTPGSTGVALKWDQGNWNQGDWQ